MRELIDLIIHSRQAPKIVSKWVAWQEDGIVTARGKKEAKDKYLQERGFEVVLIDKDTPRNC